MLKGKRLSGAFGSLYGVKIPENLADEMPDEKDLPYLEMLYKFVYGKQSYYDLASTRHVEPQSKDNDNEAEELRRQRGGDVISDVATDGRGTERTARRARTVERTVPQYIRKKKHWQISPYVRVRTRARIRQWDGFLYNIDLFPYVENKVLAFCLK
ncbi:putative replication protein [Acinetobacter baumannii]|nr:putative replication protein [Acinetobacter baumannii]